MTYLFFSDGSKRGMDTFEFIFIVFKHAIGMEINERNHSLTYNNLEKDDTYYITGKLPYEKLIFYKGYKYLSFHQTQQL